MLALKGPLNYDNHPTIPSHTVCFGMPYSSQMILLSGNSLLLPRSGLLRRGGRGRDGWERPEIQAAGER